VSTISSITTLGRLDRREELRLHQRVRNRGDPDAKKLRAALLRVLTLLESLRCLEAEARQHLADVRAPTRGRRGQGAARGDVADPRAITFTPMRTSAGMRYRLSARMSAEELIRIEGDPDGI